MVLLSHQHERGFSLVELMVALVLGVILTSGVISVYITSKSTYNVNNGLGQVEESGRYALNFLQPIVATGGYLGCAKTSSVTNAITPLSTVPVYDFGDAVYGYEASGTNIGQTIVGVNSKPALSTNAGNWSPSLTNNDGSSVLYNAISGATGGLVDGSDVLMVHAAGPSVPAWLVGPTYNDGASLYIASSTSASAAVTAANFTAGEIALVANCSTTPTAFQITAVSTSAGTLAYATGVGSPGNSSLVSATFNAGSAVQLLQSYVFYVGKGVDGWPALYEAKFNASGALTPTEIVSGVENMQVLYGVDTDGDQVPNNFQTADTVDATNIWGNVVSVRVALLMQSDDDSIDKAPAAGTNVYMLGINSGDSVIFKTPVDRRLRRYFVQTLSLRNKLQ